MFPAKPEANGVSTKEQQEWSVGSTALASFINIKCKCEPLSLQQEQGLPPAAACCLERQTSADMTATRLKWR